MEMTSKLWRVADLHFEPFDEPGSNRQLERATIDSAKGQLSNASEKEPDAHLSWLYGGVGNG
jgi:hypothetical protein